MITIIIRLSADNDNAFNNFILFIDMGKIFFYYFIMLSIFLAAITEMTIICNHTLDNLINQYYDKLYKVAAITEMTMIMIMITITHPHINR